MKKDNKRSYLQALDLPACFLIAVGITIVVSKNNFVKDNILFTLGTVVVLYLLRLSILLFAKKGEH